MFQWPVGGGSKLTVDAYTISFLPHPTFISNQRIYHWYEQIDTRWSNIPKILHLESSHVTKYHLMVFLILLVCHTNKI
jgi:hypothetical protein